ncbi:MAG: hypothetical protein ABEH59_08925 [Halobacteriales archaeon]
MRRKPLPPTPAALDTVSDAQNAVPLVPSPENDCCARLQDRLDLEARDTAATWLDFLRGLGLAEEGPAGFSRGRTDLEQDELATRFLEAVYGAEEVRSTLREADAPLAAATVANRTESLISPWERQRDGHRSPEVWETRTKNLLDWLVLLGIAADTKEGYTAPRTD